MNSTGSLRVSARWANGRIEQLSVDLQRPTVSRLFIGQSPDAVVKTVPYLYTLCAEAQRAAAQLALAAARGEALPRLDARALWTESLHENLWRLLLDWPPALGLLPEKAAFVAWRAERLGDNAWAATQQLMAQTLEPLAEKCLERLVHRSSGPVSPPALNAAGWLAHWRDEQTQAPAQPGPESVASAYRARLADAARAAAALAGGESMPVAAGGDDGWGVGQALTARGVLTHAVHVVDDAVAHYRVQAPTDASFADAGPLRALLAEAEFADVAQARQGIEQAILALDPCLPYELAVGAANGDNGRSSRDGPNARKVN